MEIQKVIDELDASQLTMDACLFLALMWQKNVEEARGESMGERGECLKGMSKEQLIFCVKLWMNEWALKNKIEELRQLSLLNLEKVKMCQKLKSKIFPEVRGARERVVKRTL
tara:strand:- start:43 stop:378 length:336 start_codon:yes stop_codon:yes gene_type:complete